MATRGWEEVAGCRGGAEVLAGVGGAPSIMGWGGRVDSLVREGRDTRGTNTGCFFTSPYGQPRRGPKLNPENNPP